MSYSAPLELLTDSQGSITFGWIDDATYYARFSRCLSARLGEAFAAGLRAAALSRAQLRYFGDGRALESYDLVARRAFAHVIVECRRKFQEVTLLAWSGAPLDDRFVSALGKPVVVTQNALEFERRLFTCGPGARTKLASGPDSRFRSRWPLGH